MSFQTTITNDIPKIGSGEIFKDSAAIVLSASDFEDGLKVGLFAKLDAGSIDNLDGSVTPVIAGVVIRDVASAIEEDGTLTSEFHSLVTYTRKGLITVEVKDGESPVQFGEVFASNAGDADDGKALTAGGEATGYEFIKEIKTNVWLVLK